MSDTNDRNIINVIEDFDYSTQSDVYNEKFRKWRRNSDNPFAFGFKNNKRESVYVTGKGFVEDSALDAEKNVLTRLFNLIGIAALMWVVADNGAVKLAALIMSRIGFDVNISFFSSNISGGSAESLAVLLIGGLLKLAVPLLYLHFKLRLPAKVEFMSRTHDPMALIGAISSTFIVCAAVSIPVAYSGDSKEIYEYFAGVNADISMWEQKEFVIYLIFDVVIASVLMELIFRGGMFAALRQFGDPFAIVITAVTSALLTQNFIAMPAAFLVSLVAGYGLLSSGTLFTAVAVHIVYKMYTFTLTLIEIDTTDKMPLNRNLFMIVTLIVGSVGLAVYWIGAIRRKKTNLALYRSELTVKRRYIHSVKTFPYSAVAILCIVQAVIKAVL